MQNLHIHYKREVTKNQAFVQKEMIKMKAVQIDRYSKEVKAKVREIPKPEVGDGEVLVKVMASAVNPLEILIMTGAVKLIAKYKFPLTLGNECSGIVEKVGKR